MSLKPQKIKKKFIYDIKESEDEGLEYNLMKIHKVSVFYYCKFYDIKKLQRFDFKEIGYRCISLK